MKLVTNRNKLSKIINYHLMPVVEVDLADTNEYGLVSKPVLVRSKFKDGTPNFIECYINAFRDEKKFVFRAEPTTVSANFGYYDVKNMLKFSNAPVIGTDEDVLIVIIDSEKKNVISAMILHTDKKIDSFCQQPLEFIDDNYSLDLFELV